MFQLRHNKLNSGPVSRAKDSPPGLDLPPAACRPVSTSPLAPEPACPPRPRPGKVPSLHDPDVCVVLLL